jgi:hypothetical protein
MGSAVFGAVGASEGVGMTTVGAMGCSTIACISAAALMCIGGICYTTYWGQEWSYKGAYFKTLSKLLDKEGLMAEGENIADMTAKEWQERNKIVKNIKDRLDRLQGRMARNIQTEEEEEEKKN